jgi:hypothetical protein
MRASIIAWIGVAALAAFFCRQVAEQGGCQPVNVRARVCLAVPCGGARFPPQLSWSAAHVTPLRLSALPYISSSLPV